ncbi:MAG: hypothetical protein Ta2B_15140 [Termitinemataceae bacterium]|nr:MAG: hypothetical protein Ta2B_15140 [Termitinemataceae bacterium]
MNNEIALIRVNYDTHFSSPCLGIGYLASFLKANGHPVLFIDGLRDKLNNENILYILKKKGIQIAGITCLTFYYTEVISLSRYLKENGIKVIIGGIHPTFMPYQTLVDSNADYVICGEGEIALLTLLQNDMSNSTGGGGVK